MPAVVEPTELLGTWRLERRVHDRSIGLLGQVTGTLELRADGVDVRWLERGVLRWDGRRTEVTRELWIVPEGDGWTVRFADGRDFHPWHPGAVVTHPCRADLYRGRVDVDASRTRLRVLWDVTGPAKDQRLFTRCRREARSWPAGDSRTERPAAVASAP